MSITPSPKSGEETTTPSPRGRVTERQEGVQQDINRTTTRPRMLLRSNDGDLLHKEVKLLGFTQPTRLKRLDPSDKVLRMTVKTTSPRVKAGMR